MKRKFRRRRRSATPRRCPAGRPRPRCRVGAPVAVGPRGAAELGDERDDGLPPGRAERLGKRAHGGVEIGEHGGTEEGADGHCQTGNLAYSAAVSMDWLDELFR